MSQQRQELGRSGEDLAAEYLANAGYRVIERNARVGRGEIDIVAEGTGGRGQSILVFVEVKTARAGRFGGPLQAAYAVDRRKQLQVRRLGREWLGQKRRRGWAEVRFDVIGVTLGQDKPDIEHYEAAF